MDTAPENEITDIIQNQEEIPKYVDNEYFGKHQCVHITKPISVLSRNAVSFAMVLRSGQLSYDPYDMSHTDEEFLMPNNGCKMTP